jgi:hypothetical protein
MNIGVSMDVEFLYYDGCPSHDDALSRLKMVLTREGIDAHISVIKIETEEEAREFRFVGSPTIRIEGRDIDPPPLDAVFGLTCRAFRLEDGRISPLPSEKMILDAVRSSKG